MKTKYTLANDRKEFEGDYQVINSKEIKFGDHVGYGRIAKEPELEIFFPVHSVKPDEREFGALIFSDITGDYKLYTYFNKEAKVISTPESKPFCKKNGMKHKIYLDLENTPKLKDLGYRKMNISIRLNDECKNGHEDFAITGDAWSLGKVGEADTGGCIHEDILAVRPDLKIFVDLHLCDRKGVPMHGVANGMYWIFSEKKYDYAKESLMITDAELDILKQLPDDDKEYFQYVIENMLLPERWQMIANQAIEKLEYLTGQKYVDHSTKETFTKLSDNKRLEIRQKVETGYYLPDKIKERKQMKIDEINKKKAEKLLNETKEKIDSARIELNVQLWFLHNGIDTEQIIFYNHSKTVSFNWRGYGKKFERSEFDSIVERMKDLSFIVENNVKFEFKP